MIPATTFSGSSVAVFGLGRSGIVTCQSLLAGGARVAAWDDNEAARAQAASVGISVVDLSAADWSTFQSFVLAPGVPLTHPEPHWTVKCAQAAGCEIIGDIEILFRERRCHAPGCPLVAITGTNGKSTTTALTAHVLSAAGRDVQMGGNIGVAALSLEPPTDARVYVLELSSYQIDLTPSLHPSVGLVLNVSPDHIDRHGNFANYAAVKERIAETSDLAIIGVDERLGDRDPCAAMIARRRASGRPLGLFTRASSQTPGAVFGDGQTLRRGTDADGSATVEIANLQGAAALAGSHNIENAAAAFLVGEALGVSPDVITAGLLTFPGLAHRMEPVATCPTDSGAGEVTFINDSKATNADSADRALGAYARDIYWIAGGLAKEGGVAPLAGHFGRIAHAYLVGKAAAEFASQIAGACPVTIAGTIDAAVDLATAAARQSSGAAPVVLLSPACASFDQFANFELRGQAFRKAVARQPGVEMRGGSS